MDEWGLPLLVVSLMVGPGILVVIIVEARYGRLYRRGQLGGARYLRILRITAGILPSCMLIPVFLLSPAALELEGWAWLLGICGVFGLFMYAIGYSIRMPGDLLSRLEAATRRERDQRSRERELVRRREKLKRLRGVKKRTRGAA